MRSLPLEPENRRIEIGARLRAIRKARYLTIDDVAKVSGLTKGFISRIERDQVSPSLNTLVELCDVLSIQIGSLFEPLEVQVVRAGEGPHLELGGIEAEERLISPRHESRVQVIRSTIGPEGRSGDELYSLSADVELMHVLSGEVDAIFSGDSWRLGPGDTATFKGTEPHSWSVASPGGAEVIWVLVPALWKL
ncbi:helix-turn-helix domain-containing protein [Corynebacterium provencense]|uniref:helix-turn-helix domain-containing protein n=1 Tax=Corynebacterium provencense TaxID=1737425 RepID=UPI00082C1540|nr:helix-turn-helix domain-containing protein [Corynebacterium provencense]